MPKVTDTYALAYECCDRVLQETERFPTIEAIRERIGVNSPNTIKKAMNDWTVAFARKHFAALHRPDLPIALQDATETLWHLALKEAAVLHAEASRQQEAEREQLHQDILALKQHVRQLEEELTSAGNNLTELRSEFNQSQGLLSEYRQIRDDQHQTILSLQTQMQQLELQRADEREHAKQQQQDNEAWYQRRIVEERELAATQWQARVEHLESLNEVLNKTRQQQNQHYQELQTQHQQLRQQVKQLETALAEAQHKPKLRRWTRKS